ncbi:MAG: RNA methyltransferase, partial [Proteobacteria bacterium]
MITIASPQNPKIKELVALRESRERRRTSLFVIEGAQFDADFFAHNVCL